MVRVSIISLPPFGIASIVFAAQVDGKYSTGDYAGAEASAAKSKKWMWWAFGIGLVVQILAFGGGFAGALTSGAMHQ